MVGKAPGSILVPTPNLNGVPLYAQLLSAILCVPLRLL
jgi:hypothetical protein